MEKWLSIGQMIDTLLKNPNLKFIDSKNKWTALINRECIVFSKFEGHRTTSIMLNDKDLIWKIKE
jgi:hypothetical protein